MTFIDGGEARPWGEHGVVGESPGGPQRMEPHPLLQGGGKDGDNLSPRHLPVPLHPLHHAHDPLQLKKSSGIYKLYIKSFS